jgi:hypothetical protein
MEIICESNLLRKEVVGALLAEANELVAIMVASRRSTLGILKSKIENRKYKTEQST